MNGMHLAATISASLLLAGCGASAEQAKGGNADLAASECTTMSPGALNDKFAEFNAAWATKDPAKVTALFDDDAVLLPTLSNTPRTDHAAIDDYFVEFLKKSPVGKIDTSTIKSGCNWA